MSFMAKKNRYRGRGGQNNSNGGGGAGGGRGGRRRGRNRRNKKGGGGQGGGYSQERRRRYDEPTGPIPEVGYGMLELHPKGYGFLRGPSNNYSREHSDPFVPGTMIDRFRLRQGVMLRGYLQQGRKQQGPRVREIVDVDGMEPEAYLDVKGFDELTPINPEQYLHLEVGAHPLTNRVIDLLAPLGKGQRALIVAPPRSGKTVMLQHISQGVSQNHPDVKLVVLLIDERPEEVTDMRRNVDGEVIASSLDEDVESHVRLSQLVVDRCKRLAEMGQDVFLLLDSITRLARAFNKWVGNKGATMSGGVNIKAMDVPKKLFATARAFEEGGSLTVVGTALVDTGSRMDELIFQEFKGTGNMELVLDRQIWPTAACGQRSTSRRRAYPSRRHCCTRPSTLHAVTMLRRTLSSMHPVEAMEQLTRQLGRFENNAEFIKLISNASLVD